MYVIVWEYSVPAQQRAEFERIYGAGGSWAQLFQEGDGFLGTELCRDETRQDRYLTIDHWLSRAAFEAFQEAHRLEYERLDARCSRLTEAEDCIGNFTSEASDG